MYLRFLSAARECLVMKRTTFAKRLRSIRLASKQGIERHDQSSQILDLARGGASGEGAPCAEIPLRTEQLVSFADICCAKRSNCGL